MKQPILKGYRTRITGYLMTTGIAVFNLLSSDGFDIHDPHAWLNVILLAGGPLIDKFYRAK